MCMDVGPDPIPRLGGYGCSGATWGAEPGPQPGGGVDGVAGKLALRAAGPEPAGSKPGR